MQSTTRRVLACSLALAFAASLHAVAAASAGVVKDVEIQPLVAQLDRVIEALDYIGSPVSAETKEEFHRLQNEVTTQPAGTIEKIQKLFDPLCLVLVEINPESRVKVMRGAADAELVENGWR